MVEELPPAHTLVLNKYNTMTDHALVITKEFHPQEAALTELGELLFLFTPSFFLA